MNEDELLKQNQNTVSKRENVHPVVMCYRHIICTLALLSATHQLPTSADRNVSAQMLREDLVDSWQLDLTPRYSKVSIERIEDILNPLPFQLKYVMAQDEFETFGALFRYSLICGDGDRSSTLRLDHTMYQTTNDRDWLYRTTIRQFTVPWDALSGARVSDFVNARCHLLVSWPSPANAQVVLFEDVVTFTLPSEPTLFRTVPSFFFTDDYGKAHSRNTSSSVLLLIPNMTASPISVHVT